MENIIETILFDAKCFEMNAQIFIICISNEVFEDLLYMTQNNFISCSCKSRLRNIFYIQAYFFRRRNDCALILVTYLWPNKFSCNMNFFEYYSVMSVFSFKLLWYYSSSLLGMLKTTLTF